ncbi:MAG: hypothetical protein KGL39_41865 [Patescibacteria group bacterium]|nr:hypothetical protein [Patescibacteria group bacterium]
MGDPRKAALRAVKRHGIEGAREIGLEMRAAARAMPEGDSESMADIAQRMIKTVACSWQLDFNDALHAIEAEAFWRSEAEGAKDDTERDSCLSSARFWADRAGIPA